VISPVLQGVLDVARETKQALYDIEGFDRIPGFSDDINKGNGIITQCAGAVSLLLLHKTFANEKQVIQPQDKAKTVEIILTVFNSVKQLVGDWGYNATPFASGNQTKDIFSSDKGYIGSLTWVLSLCMLIRYNNRMAYLEFPDEFLQEITEAIPELLKTICLSQIMIDDTTGAWGFSTDSDNISLYFTYTVSASLGDYYDYLFEEFKDCDRNEDIELKEMLNERTFVVRGQTKTVFAAVEEARTALQMWVIKYALPILPDCAEARLPAKLLPAMGIWELDKNKANPDLGLDTKFHYNYLYYAQYIFDMIISSIANQRFNTIFSSGGTEAEDIRKFYEEHGLFPVADLEYYFENDHTDVLVEKIMDQSIHALRLNISKASRTKDRYWESLDAAVFDMKWGYSDSKKNTKQMELASKNIKDPVILPLFLRVNTLYSYYISERTDKIIDEIFGQIILDRQGSGEFMNLWDSLAFNIMITEKAVEGITDYYNYLLKYAAPEPAVEVKEVPIVNPEPIKEAILEAVQEYLKSREGKELLTGVLGNAPASYPVNAVSPASINSDMLAKSIRELLGKMSDSLENLGAFSESNEVSLAAVEFVDFHNNLIRGWAYKALLSQNLSNSGAEAIDIGKSQTELLLNQLRTLTNHLCHDLTSDNAFGSSLYSALKTLKKSQSPQNRKDTV